jgi:DNA replication protein DnaC
MITPCQTCGGTGFVDLDTAKRCSCRKEVDRICALAIGNVPKEFWYSEKTPFNGETEPLIEHVRAWKIRNASRMGRGLVMFGPSGTGKTSAATLALSRAARRGYDVGYVTAPELVMSEIGDRDDETLYAWRGELLYDSHFLVIDELGKEHRKENSDYSLSILDLLLRRRRGDMKSTILITNFSWARFHQVYGESVWSIMADRAEKLQFHGEDRRQNRG